MKSVPVTGISTAEAEFLVGAVRVGTDVLLVSSTALAADEGVEVAATSHNVVLLIVLSCKTPFNVYDTLKLPVCGSEFAKTRSFAPAGTVKS